MKHSDWLLQVMWLLLTNPSDLFYHSVAILLFYWIVISVWPDFAKFRNFVKVLNVICYVIGQKVVEVNDKIWKLWIIFWINHHLVLMNIRWIRDQKSFEKYFFHQVLSGFCYHKKCCLFLSKVEAIASRLICSDVKLRCVALNMKY